LTNKKNNATGNEMPVTFYFPEQALRSLSAVGFPTLNVIDTSHDSQIFILNSTKKYKGSERWNEK
jgi:hypothetical protein